MFENEDPYQERPLERPLSDLSVRHLRGGMSRNTNRGYRQKQTEFINWCFRSLETEPLVGHLSADLVMRFIASLKVSDGSRASYASDLRAWINWGVSVDYIPATAWTGFRMPVRPTKETIIVFENGDLDLIFGELERNRTYASVRLAAIVRVLLDCGARPTEVVGLTGRDLFRATGQLYLRGKGGRARFAPIGQSAWRAIDQYLRVRGPIEHPDDAVFLSMRGHSALGVDGLIDDFADLLDKVGLARRSRERTAAACPPRASQVRIAASEIGYSLYTLKATFCRRFADGGGDVRTMAAIIGHSEHSLTVLHRHYYRPSAANLKEAHLRAAPGDRYEAERRTRLQRRAA